MDIIIAIVVLGLVLGYRDFLTGMLLLFVSVGLLIMYPIMLFQIIIGLIFFFYLVKISTKEKDLKKD